MPLIRNLLIYKELHFKPTHFERKISRARKIKAEKTD
ncbi:hypothetical protein FIC_00073 [Flavobacteriaceae bacterium 3519-10]|nr:hypothetical protein FIC_00073 [Flavobacteriaceae bacterium 3519-10]